MWVCSRQKFSLRASLEYEVFCDDNNFPGDAVNYFAILRSEDQIN